MSPNRLVSTQRFSIRVSFVSFISAYHLGPTLGHSYLLYAIVLLIVFALYLVVVSTIINKISQNETPSFANRVLSTLLIAFQVILLLSFLRTPDVSQYVSESASANFRICAIVFMALFASFASETGWAERVGHARAILAGSAIFPITMLASDWASGALKTQVDSFMIGQRVLNTTLVTSPNTIAIAAAVGLMCCLILGRTGGGRSWYLASAIPVFYLLITQSQGMIAASTLCCLGTLFPRFASRSMAYSTLGLWALSTPVVVLLSPLIENSVLEQITTRPEATHLGFATGRVLLWREALSISVSSPSQFLFGSGYMSAMTTSLRSIFQGVIFSSQDQDITARILSLHNAAIQYLFEIGFLGLSIASGLWFISIRNNFRGKTPIGAHLNIFALLILISGLSESTGTVYSLTSFFPMMGIWAFSIFNYKQGQAEVYHRKTPRAQRYLRFRPVPTR